MNAASRTVPRRVAERLSRLARLLAPGARRQWADAMHNELWHVPDDWAAVRWAGGCLNAVLAERLRVLFLLDLALVRAVGSALLAFKAFDAAFATAMTLLYRSNAVDFLGPLGRLTPGDDFNRLVPLMDAMPLWLHALWVLAGATYGCAITALLRRSAATYAFVMGAVALEIGAMWLGRPVVAAIGVAANPSPSWIAALLLPIVLPLMVALAARSGSRHQPA